MYMTQALLCSLPALVYNSTPLPISGNWVAMAYGGGTFIAVDKDTGNTVRTDDTGLTWTVGSLPVSGYWTSMAYGNGRFILLNTGTNQLLISNDGGASWSTNSYVPPVTTIHWLAIAYEEGGKFTLTSHYITDMSEIYTTSDGVAFSTSLGISSVPAWTVIATTQGCTIISNTQTPSGGATTRTLDKGIIWTSGFPRPASPVIALAGGTFGSANPIFVGIEAGSICARSTDKGLSWTDLSVPVPSCNAIAYGNSTLLALRTTGNLLMKSYSGGTSWITYSVPFTGCTNVVYAFGVFMTLSPTTAYMIAP
jgi:hypothetical protein